MAVHLPISLERFAQLQAQLDGGAARAEVLAGARLPVPTWEQARDGWLTRMKEEARRGRLQLAHVYQRAYVSCFTPEREDALPSPVARPAEGALDDVGGTSFGLQIDWGEALPFGADGDAEAPAPADVPIAAHADVGATIAGGELRAEDLLLPFGKPAAPASAEPSPAAPPVPAAPLSASRPAPAPPSSAAAGRPAASVDSTTFGVSALADEEVLPFGGEAPAPAPSARAASTPDVGATVFGAKLDLGDAIPFEDSIADEASIDETTFGAAPVAGGALPFAEGIDARFGGPAPSDSGVDLDSSDVGGTSFGVRLDLGDVTPFEEEASSAGPTLTLDQYAAFCVERRLWPDRVAEIAARYGVDPATEDAHHRVPLAQPETRRAFDEAAARYEAWLRSR